MKSEEGNMPARIARSSITTGRRKSLLAVFASKRSNLGFKKSISSIATSQKTLLVMTFREFFSNRIEDRGSPAQASDGPGDVPAMILKEKDRARIAWFKPIY
jgi:hypothetical protein